MRKMKIELSLALQNLQSHTIGLFQLGSAPPEMVIKNDDGVLTTIAIGSLGGVNTNHISAEQGMYREFPDGKSMTQMMKNPYEFYDFKKQFAG